MSSLIKYTQFIGIRTAENGSAGFITNSTNYSMLIVYTDGTCKIVEGDAHAMAPFLPFLKEDNTAQMLTTALQQLEARLTRNLAHLVDSRISRLFDSMHPIPDVTNLPASEAIEKLKAANFSIDLTNDYPKDAPEGYVHQYHRKQNNYMTVELDIRHPLPDVVGMAEDEAISLLKKAGFTVHLAVEHPEGIPAGTVCSCTRPSETALSVILTIRHALPDVIGLKQDEAVALLEKAGFTVTLKNNHPRSNRQGTVYACTRPSETALSVTLTLCHEMYHGELVVKPFLKIPSFAIDILARPEYNRSREIPTYPTCKEAR